jgi:hypothetical protein
VQNARSDTGNFESNLMATKAELEAELVQLKAELARHTDLADAPDAAGRDTSQDEAEPAPDTDTEWSRLKLVLAEHGLDEDDLTAFGQKLLHEVQDLHKEKPMVTLIAAFAIGCLVGRVIK